MAFQFLDRGARLPSTAAAVAARFDPDGDDWWMTDAERLALVALLSDLRPECAIEVGVYRAGSLTILSRFSRKVYALDIDPACETLFRDKFPNVEFITGDAAHTLPDLLTRIHESGEPLGFILIDADHSREGVRRTVENVLRFKPARPLFLLLHDSFNPECRQGMKDVDWSANPHVNLVELDFVPGRFVTEEEPDGTGEMWCGFALAVLLPEPRHGDLAVHENESLAFRTAFRHSAYRYNRWWNPAYLVRSLKRRAKGGLRERAPRLYGILRRYTGGTAP